MIYLFIFFFTGGSFFYNVVYSWALCHILKLICGIKYLLTKYAYSTIVLGLCHKSLNYVLALALKWGVTPLVYTTLNWFVFIPSWVGDFFFYTITYPFSAVFLPAVAAVSPAEAISAVSELFLNFFIIDFLTLINFYINYFFFSEFSLILSYSFILKLVVSWFVVVWLRMNLLRFRFDQVATYTWHELVIFGIFLLIEVVVCFWIL